MKIETSVSVILFTSMIVALFSLPSISELTTIDKIIYPSNSSFSFKGIYNFHNESYHVIYLGKDSFYKELYQDHSEIYVPLVLQTVNLSYANFSGDAEEVNLAYPNWTQYVINQYNYTNNSFIVNYDFVNHFTSEGFTVLNVSMYEVTSLNSTDSGAMIGLKLLNESTLSTTLNSNTSQKWYYLRLDILPFQEGSFNISFYEDYPDYSDQFIWIFDPPISGCGLIPSNGTWTLTNDVISSNTCFSFNVSNTIFDCNFFKLTNNVSNFSASAFNISNKTNMTLKNCNINNFGIGISASNFSGLVLDSILINQSINTSVLLNGSGNTNITTLNISNGNGTSLRKQGSGNVNISNLNIFNSTNYIIHENGTLNISNLTLGNSEQNFISWSNVNFSSALNLTDTSNIYLRSNFISINSSTSILNKSANISFYSPNCSQILIKKLDGFPTSQNSIVVNGTFFGYATCNNSIATFNVSSFSGYALWYSNLSYVVTSRSDDLNFSCSQPYENSTQPDYQNILTPFFNVTNSLNTTLYNITLSLSSTIFNNTVKIFTWNSGYRPINQTQNWSQTGHGIINIPILLNTTNQTILRRLRANESQGIWLWGDCLNVSDNQTFSANISFGGGTS